MSLPRKVLLWILKNYNRWKIFHLQVGHSRVNKIKRGQSFLGLCSYYRRNIQNFAAIARPLTWLKNKDITFIWGTDQGSSFNALKVALTSAPVLAHPNYDLPMEILPDACEDLVLVYKPFRKVGKSEKLLHRWLGPFKVLRKTTLVNYELSQEIVSNNLEEADEKEQREDQEIQSQKVPEVTSLQAVADNEKKVTEHPTADGVMVAPLTSTEVAPTQRPIRNRTPP
ncbi:Uncharacterized protein APZ42_011159 [Daphnia magna]|uniref:RNA-directed DNA polymerase n=1 Tax=Daphnia magna TaxID=35525 RepID=A0A162T2B6_9CRUS|nr:Uncharacterized protein APZ42_011159 [Daphnia magna]